MTFGLVYTSTHSYPKGKLYNLLSFHPATLNFSCCFLQVTELTISSQIKYWPSLSQGDTVLYFIVIIFYCNYANLEV